MLNENVSRKLVIFGSGALAELSHFYFTHDSDFEVVGFTVDDKYFTSDEYLGLPCVPVSKLHFTFPSDSYSLFIAIGYSNLNATRIAKYEMVKSMGYRLASYVSSKAQQWPNNLQVGENVMIMEGNSIMPFCKIGNNVLIWIGNILSHHSTIGDHTCITSHVALGGCVTVGERCFFGLNSTIRDSIQIADGTVVAASANVIKSTQAQGVYMGNPAKMVSTAESIKI
jgi:sugar O-acyltransferase (sialic acid O-acetyltransferase NeuD family)